MLARAASVLGDVQSLQELRVDLRRRDKARRTKMKRDKDHGREGREGEKEAVGRGEEHTVSKMSKRWRIRGSFSLYMRGESGPYCRAA